MINTSTSDENLCGLKRADFQTTVNGKQTDLFILKNENGAEIAVYQLWWSSISYYGSGQKR